jgi:hypothetical protein
MTHSRKFVAIVVCCAAVSAVLVGHASAARIFQESYHFGGSSEIENFCGVDGLTVRDDSVVDGKIRAVAHGPDGQAYFLDHLKETAVTTNLANGKAVTFVFTGTRTERR